MAGLLGLLDVGANAFRAQNAGVAVSGRNISNINSEGYSREGITPTGDFVRQDAPLLASRERLAAGSSGMADAQAAALGSLETSLTDSGADVAAAVGDFFGATDRPAAAPADEALRRAVVEKARALAESLN